MSKSDVFRALADPTRRAVFERLLAGEKNATELRDGLAISQPAVSQHIAVLRSAGLINEARAGRHTNYSVNPDGLEPLFDWLTRYPHRLAATRRAPQDPPEGDGSMTDLAEDTQADETIVVDCELDAAPDKVWRAVTVPELAEQWITDETEQRDGRSYRLLDAEPCTPRALCLDRPVVQRTGDGRHHRPDADARWANAVPAHAFDRRAGTALRRKHQPAPRDGARGLI
jgi:DNA-binding transcriptional ArsR family regulator